MGRPVINFTSDEWRAIAAAAASANEAAPHHSHNEFVDQFIAAVACTTGRLYGQSLYERMLSTVGIRRRPSAQTWSNAIRRAWEAGLPERRSGNGREAGEMIAPPPAAILCPLPADEQSDEMMDLRVRVEVAEMGLRDAYARLARYEAECTAIRARADEQGDEMMNLRMRAEVAEMSLRDAYARLARYEAECTTVKARAMSAESQVGELTQQLKRERAEHDKRTAELLQRLDALASAVQRVVGLENHMRMQTDDLRQQMSEQCRYWKGRAEVLDKALADERIKTDAMRRLLGNRVPPSA